MTVPQYFKQSPIYVHLSMAMFIACFLLSNFLNIPALLYIGFYIALYAALDELTTHLNKTPAEKSHGLQFGCLLIFPLMMAGIIIFPVPAILITCINLLLVAAVVHHLVGVLSSKTLRSKETIVSQFKHKKVAMLVLLSSVTVLRIFIDSLGLAVTNHCFLLIIALMVFNDCKDIITDSN
ncbi:hypothetical protein ACSLBF_12870 [Pseudoalteromonas sp. T1lg65]|uniref:hypothetical protein n=1 Tax=Pseudoalteromonas sp. T1lg65 TaxID=2077101 RepID=UPI003F7990EA